MSDEKEFDRALRFAGNFSNVKVKTSIWHPTLPNSYLEVDNLAQKGKIVFVFEGKFNKE